MDKKTISICTAAACGAFLGILCLGSLSGCGKKNQVLAYVNGQPITLSEFYEYLQIKPQVSVQTENGKINLPVDGTLGFQAVKDEINEMVELEIAKEQGLMPTDAEVEAEIRGRLKRDPSYLVDLESKGVTTDLIKKSVQVDLAVEKILTKGVTVTEEDTKKYVKSHSSQFMEPARVTLSYILLTDKAEIDKADQELASGQSFAQVALEYSKAPTAHSYNGQFSDPSKPPIFLSSLPQFLQNAISPLHEDESTAWIHFSDGYAKFYLNKRFPAKAIRLTVDMLEQLRRNLAKAKGAQVHNLDAMIAKKLKQSKVDIVQDAYKDDWTSLNDQ